MFTFHVPVYIHRKGEFLSLVMGICVFALVVIIKRKSGGEEK